MESNRALYLGLIFLLLAVDSSFLDFKVIVYAKSDAQDSQLNEKKDLDKPGGESSSVSGSGGGDNVNKQNKNQKGDLKGENDDSREINDGKLSSQAKSEKGDKRSAGSDGLSSQSEFKKEDKPQKVTIDSNVNGEGGDGGKNEKTSDKNKNASTAESGLIASQDTRVEECDPSSQCKDVENHLVACIRAQGNDKHSLLVQNKGKSPLKVTISAPDYVKLKKTDIKLQPKQDKEVQVSITQGGSDNFIVLRAGNGECKLDINHLVSENFGQGFDNSKKPSSMKFMTRTSAFVVFVLAALLVLAAGWTCISLQRKQHLSSGSKYQRLDSELPVSTGTKAESEQNVEWDDKWGDDWDDEEAPKTPSMPVTPSLSSKGLASRRSSKEGWKD